MNCYDCKQWANIFFIILFIFVFGFMGYYCFGIYLSLQYQYYESLDEFRQLVYKARKFNRLKISIYQKLYLRGAYFYKNHDR